MPSSDSPKPFEELKAPAAYPRRRRIIQCDFLALTYLAQECLMHGRMLGRFRHSLVIFSVMLIMFVGTIMSAIYFDTLKQGGMLWATSSQAWQHFFLLVYLAYALLHPERL